MKQINYKLKVKHVGDPDSSAWVEEMTYMVENDVTADQHGRSIVDRFNASLKPNEQPREFIEALDGTTSKPSQSVEFLHQWEKTSLVTQKGGYDVMTCKVCGAKGKRFGLGQSGVKPDRKTQQYCKIKIK
jgi:hypothetical protein